GLVEALPKLFVEEVTEQLRKRTMPAFAKAWDLRVAKLGDDAGVMGCAAWARQVIGPATEAPALESAAV
ncbi:MAG TPA: hypothetical protein VFG20_06835, partial [Planctomycetaceae bacterium]|nr:hypothetical protein [Planctomycetaceae bacterium]